ncbi:MAG TPA: serine hydroxymethyltransferase, partial [Spirochaetales bacterium]|nr:serine hydroxymethyltransferase [Spirochaetales bacterium]
GLVAAGLHPSPIQLADFTTTTTHKTLRGPRGGAIFIGKDKENNQGITKKVKDETKLKTWGEIVDSTVFPGIQGGPLCHVIAGKAVAFHEALQPEYKTYMKQVLANAKVLAKALADGGARIVSGGTDNHLMLVDLTPLGISGKEAEKWLDEASITVNKNGIPFDPKTAFTTSGIRVGTPAVTSRGMKEVEMTQIAGFVVDVLKSKGDASTIAKVKDGVRALTKRFGLPSDL